jgi:tetratricopeptide (TPR) repeat protein
VDEAIACYRKAIALAPKLPGAHYNLGNALRDKGKVEEAIACFRQAISLNPNFAVAHCYLGRALQKRGEFRQALEALRRGHKLKIRNPGWPYPSAQWIQSCERQVELEGRLTDFIQRKIRPASPLEGIEVAVVCTRKRLHHAAERFSEEAFAARPGLADDPRNWNRYNAACAAALTGCGQGKDADRLDGKERARLRGQALDRLRADLQAWQRLLEKDTGRVRPVLVEKLRHWLVDRDFAGVRGPEALAGFPEAERPAWQKLWADVTDTLTRAREKTAPRKQPDGK